MPTYDQCIQLPVTQLKEMIFAPHVWLGCRHLVHYLHLVCLEMQQLNQTLSLLLSLRQPCPCRNSRKQHVLCASQSTMLSALHNLEA